ncbi:MAG: serine/threonine-protein kinase [Planctomycetota bacterium]|jgi:tRNA A-37 threonylcarbamoyl transferase component Bud32/tetratricopeptide (TPR) repeat protein
MTQESEQGMAPGLRVGDKLGPYEVQDRLGSGGMGIVWRGYDRLLDRTVAIKQVAEVGGVDESARQQLRNEAMLQKRVSQTWEGIVDVIDLIDDPRGLFLVMSYVHGQSLDRVMRSGVGEAGEPLSPLAMLGVMRDVAKSLAVIHEAGIVHRDVKPGNIILAHEGPARLCDFGLASLDSDRGAADMGTAQYMAPELVAGGEIDGRADLYSLGMVAYEVLAGEENFEHVFKAVLRDRRQRALRWMKWHSNERAVAPPLHELDASIPEVLSELVARLMAKDPNQRIGSALELLEAIKLHFSKSSSAKAARVRTIEAGGADPLRRRHDAATEALPKRRTLPWVLAGLLVLQAAGFGGYIWWQKRQARLEDEAMRAAAMAQLAEAVDDYKSQRYVEAQEKFENLSQAWGPKDPLVAGQAPRQADPILGVSTASYGWISEASAYIVEARAALEEGLLAEAQRGFDLADELIGRAEEVELPPEATSLSERIGRMREDVKMRLAVVEGALEIEEHLAQHAYDDARRRFALMRNYASDLGGVVLESENRVLAELGTRIEDQESRWLRDQVVVKVESLLAEGRLADAQTTLEDGRKRWPTDAGLSDLLAVVQTRLKVRDAVRDSEQAASAGQTANAVMALQYAFDLEPTEELEHRLLRLQRARALETGQALIDKDNLEGAIAKLRESAALWENPEAEALLARLEVNRDRQAIVTAGDTALAAQRYEEAAKHFADALALSPDPDTQRKLNASKVRQHVLSADRNMTLGNLAMARGELQMALQIDTEDREANDMLKTLEVRAAYEEMLDEAEKLRAKSEFGEAKRVLSKAIQLAQDTGMDPTVAEERRTDVQYDHLIAQGRSAIEARLGKQAHALLLAAQKLRDTDVVRALIKEAAAIDEG